MQVTSLVEVWIEIMTMIRYSTLWMVTSLVEVWIEIMVAHSALLCSSPSLPLWKCGLKSLWFPTLQMAGQSLPLWKCGLKYLLR